jgi:SAM-dependent methyltransferase
MQLGKHFGSLQDQSLTVLWLPLAPLAHGVNPSGHLVRQHPFDQAVLVFRSRLPLDAYLQHGEIMSNIDLTKLDPATRAQHLGNPQGEIGVAIARSLNDSNAKAHKLAYGALAPENTNRIFEVGFGNGQLIPELLALADDLTYTGIDISETMVTEAETFNAERIKLGTVEVRIASSSAIPFPSASFDRVLALNTIYFWSDPSKDLAEIRRVLRPNGRLVLGCLDPAGTKTAPVYKQGFRFYEKEQLIDMLKTAGFLEVTIDVFHEVRKLSDGGSISTDYFIVCATT